MTGIRSSAGKLYARVRMSASVEEEEVHRIAKDGRPAMHDLAAGSYNQTRLGVMAMLVGGSSVLACGCLQCAGCPPEYHGTVTRMVLGLSPPCKTCTTTQFITPRIYTATAEPARESSYRMQLQLDQPVVMI